jgi:hypothetical protein
MTAITFPSIANAYPGMQYSAGGNNYVFDGIAWSLQASGAASLDQHLIQYLLLAH